MEGDGDMVPGKLGKWNDLEFHCRTNPCENNARARCIIVAWSDTSSHDSFAMPFFLRVFTGIALFCSPIACVVTRNNDGTVQPFLVATPRNQVSRRCYARDCSLC